MITAPFLARLSAMQAIPPDQTNSPDRLWPKWPVWSVILMISVLLAPRMNQVRPC
jgi:hypothetical protein